MRQIPILPMNCTVEYFPDRYLNSISFTDEERAFIQQSAPLKVAVIRDRYPLYYEQDGAAMGIHSGDTGAHNGTQRALNLSMCMRRIIRK